MFIEPRAIQNRLAPAERDIPLFLRTHCALTERVPWWRSTDYKHLAALRPTIFVSENLESGHESRQFKSR
jgi:hypothetical protein